MSFDEMEARRREIEGRKQQLLRRVKKHPRASYFTAFPYQVSVRRPVNMEAQIWCFDLSEDGFVDGQINEQAKWARVSIDEKTSVYCFKHEMHAVEFKMRFG